PWPLFGQSIAPASANADVSPALLAKYDKNHDGVLDAAERAAMQADMSAGAASGISDVVELTPFEVSAARDTGYQATDTLAGTRIRTELRDVGSAIQVITKEFLA